MPTLVAPTQQQRPPRRASLIEQAYQEHLQQMVSAPPAASTAPLVTVWRRRLIAGDPERDWTYCWTVDTMPGGWGPWQPDMGASLRPLKGPAIELEAFWWRPYLTIEPFHLGIRLPRDVGVAPGTYSLFVGDVAAGTIEVAAAALPAPSMSISPGTSADFAGQLEKTLQRGNVVLHPGTYNLDRAIDVPAGRRLTGYGAQLVAPRTRSQAGSIQFFHHVGDGVTIAGITFLVPGNLLSWDPAVRGLVFVDCEFRSHAWHTGALSRQGYYEDGGGTVPLLGPEGMLRSCRFTGGAVLWAEQGMILNCDWDGRAAGRSHSFVCNGTTGPLAVIGIRMNDTDRGLVTRPLNGDLENALFTDVLLFNIRTEYNGCELVCAEGDHDIKRCIYNKFQTNGCVGAAVFGSKMYDCRVQGWMLDGCDMYFAPWWDEREVAYNRIWNCELRNGTFYMGKTSHHNEARWIGVFGSRPYTRNQFWCHPNFYKEVAKSTGGFIDLGNNQATGGIHEVLYQIQDDMLPADTPVKVPAAD